MEWLGDLLGLNKGKATQAAANQNKDVIKGFDTKVTGLIDAGTGKQADYLNQSLDLASLGDNASGILGDIYGLNGAEGSARAMDAFTAGPGYQFNMDQGLQALERRAAARGNLQSGNTDLDTLGFAQGLAGQEWNNWVNGIASGVDRQIGTLGGLAGLYGQDTAQRIGLATDVASGTMGANNQVAAGKEAGQGALWTMLGNAAGVAGSLAGLGGGGSAGGMRFGYGGGF